MKRIVICDIEPLVPTIVTPMFGKENHHVVDGIARENPHMVSGKEVEVIYDDGRHFLSTTQEKFDIITSDPIDPWVKGCAALSTVEYYQMCRDHLNPGGSVCLWLPLYETSLEATKSLIATFFKVFPNGTLVEERSRRVRLRRHPVRPGRADRDRRRRARAAAGPSGPSAREAITRARRASASPTRKRARLSFRTKRSTSSPPTPGSAVARGMVAGRPDQYRPQPAAASISRAWV